MANEPAPAQDPATLIARITEDLAALRQALADRPAPAPQPSAQPKLMLTVEEAGQLIGVSRTVMYDLIGDGAIQSVKIGALRRVPRTALDAYVARLSGHQAAS
jgi:excisionase family DNA binding protein